MGCIIPSPYGSSSVGTKRPWSYSLSSYVQCALPPFAICTSTIKLGANGRIIVGQKLPTLLDVTCCVPLHILLHVVVCCCAKFETDQTFSPVLRPFARSLIHFFCPKILHNIFFNFSWIFQWSQEKMKTMHILPTTHNNMQQGVQTDATCNNQQCWKLLPNNFAPVCKGLYCEYRILNTLINHGVP